MIAKLKISVERKYVYPFFKFVDTNNSGGIEYSEFEAYIFQKWKVILVLGLIFMI